MRCFLLSIVLLLACGFANAQQPSGVSSKEWEAVNTVARTVEALHQDKEGKVWAGYDLTESPLVIGFSNGHLYAFNLEGEHPEWQKLTASHTPVLYSAIDKWGVNKVQMHPHYTVDGQDVFAINFDLMQGNPALPFFVLVHERFHQYQFEHFTPQKMSPEGYQDQLNDKNIILSQVEDTLLNDFIRASDNQRKMEILKDFVAVNQTRLALLKPSSLEWERDQQRMEGLADYVSIKTFEAFPIDSQIDGTQHLLNTLQNILKNANVADRAIKARHYGVGASMAECLDFLAVPQWKQNVEKGESLDVVLAQAIHLTDQEIKSRMQRIQQESYYKQIAQETGTAVKQYEQEIRGLLTQFKSQPGVTIALCKPRGLGMSGGGSERRMYHLGNGETISLENSSTHTSSDNLWNLKLINVPVLLQRPGGIKEFKVENNLELTLDDKQYNIADLIKNQQEQRFTSISWKGRSGEFRSENHPGKIIVNKDKVLVMF